jgi:hypothetical protein
MEDELLPLPPKKNTTNDTDTGDLIPRPPLKKYRSLISRIKEYFRDIRIWLDQRPAFPPKYQSEADSADSTDW